jgi:hypothetical protein
MFAAAAATGTERIVWALSCSVKLLVGGGRVVAGELRRRTTYAGVFSRERQAGAGAAHQPTDRGMRACVRARPPRVRENPRHRRGTRPVCPTGRWEMPNTASARRRIPVLWWSCHGQSRAREGRGTAHPCEMKKRLAVSTKVTTLSCLN